MILIIKNKKGITPIIAVVLLLMMTIAVAGLAYVWIQRMQTETQITAENQSKEVLTGMKVNLKVEGYYTKCEVATSKVNVSLFFKNAGTEPASNTQLYADDAAQSGASNTTWGAGITSFYNLTDRNCSDWINKTKKIKISSDEMSAESLITITCREGTMC